MTMPVNVGPEGPRTRKRKRHTRTSRYGERVDQPDFASNSLQSAPQIGPRATLGCSQSWKGAIAYDAGIRLFLSNNDSVGAAVRGTGDDLYGGLSGVVPSDQVARISDHFLFRILLP